MDGVKGMHNIPSRQPPPPKRTLSWGIGFLLGSNNTQLAKEAYDFNTEQRAKSLPKDHPSFLPIFFFYSFFWGEGGMEVRNSLIGQVSNGGVHNGQSNLTNISGYFSSCLIHPLQMIMLHLPSYNTITNITILSYHTEPSIWYSKILCSKMHDSNRNAIGKHCITPFHYSMFD